MDKRGLTTIVHLVWFSVLFLHQCIR
jgi:hypothetical protein